MEYNHFSYCEQLARHLKAVSHTEARPRFFTAFGLEDLYNFEDKLSGVTGTVMIAVDGQESESSDNGADALADSDTYSIILARNTRRDEPKTIDEAVAACKQNGYEVDPEIVNIYTNYRKTHNAGVFDCYTPEMRACRHSHIITGLPDAYGRGRIIGDYRRVALYGVDRLIEEKKAEHAGTQKTMNEATIRHREELAEQIRALQELGQLGKIYGFDISKPARNVRSHQRIKSHAPDCE